MSNQDSFINEVSEEVRRDRLYATFRRYGWIAVLAVIVLVAGASYNEWRKASARNVAEATGDALLAALDDDSPAARAEALAALEEPEDPGRRAVVLMLRAGAAAEAGDTEGARAAFDAVAAETDLPALYRDLAVLKSVILSTEALSPEDRIARLNSIATPGRPYRLLALEQVALAEIESGDADTALDTLRGIIADAELTQDLRQRATQLIVALGGAPTAT